MLITMLIIIIIIIIIIIHPLIIIIMQSNALRNIFFVRVIRVFYLSVNEEKGST